MKRLFALILTVLLSHISFSQLTITGVDPSANSTSLPVDGNITITFDAAIDGTTLSGNIFLRSEHSGLLSFTTSGSGTATIAINPTNDFRSGDNIFLTITDGIKSTLGESLISGQTFRFNSTVDPAYENPPVLARNDISTSSSLGSAIAVDLDSDGNMDVVSATSSLTWFQNDGSEGFNQISLLTASNILHGLHPSDLDSDGDMDIVAFSVTGDEIMWFENDGSENFTEHSVITSADGAYHVQTVDMDGDGDVDIVAAVEREGIFWYENDGAESFTEIEVNTADVSWPHAVSGIDLDSDGDMDIVSGSWANDKIAWHENDGSGNFTFNEISASADGVWSIYTIDLDGDDDVDVLSASWYDDEIAWYENDGNGNFTTHSISTNADKAYWVHAADLDGDSDIDVLSASESDNKLAWYENDGSGNFTEVLITDQLKSVGFVSAIDLNGDNRMDVLSFSSADKDIVWYENKTNSTPQLDNPIPDQSATAFLSFSYTFNEDVFSDPDGSHLMSYSATLSDDSTLPSWLSFSGPERRFSGVPGSEDGGIITVKVTAEDPNGASVTDEFDITVTVPTLMSISSTSPAVNENGVSSTSNIQIEFSETIASGTINDSNIVIRGSLTGVIAGNFSGGGTNTFTFVPTNDFKKGELVTITITTGLESEAGSILQGGKSFSFIASSGASPTTPALLVDETTLSANSKAEKIDAVDLDGDGHIDILVPITNSNRIEFHKNDGSGNFTASNISTGSFNARTIFVDDLDLDGDLDMLVGATNNTLAWFENDGSENFTSHVIDTDFSSIRSSISGDMDGDGDIDILVASQQDNTVSWYENDGNQIFSRHEITTNLSWTYNAKMADMDGDLDMDVVAGSRLAQDDILWYENDGGQNFTEHTVSLNANDVDEIIPIDLDGDGDMDVVAAERTDDEVMWYENDGDQNFTPRTIFNNTNGPISLEIADLDGDGDLDVISGSDIDNQVIWYENDGNENFTSFMIFEMEGHDIEAADFDGDGDLDIANISDAENTLKWAKNKSNTTPTVENFIDDQNAIGGITFSFTLPGNIFNDVDGNHLLSYQATLSDSSPLPSWLSFDNETLQFSGTPSTEDIGTITVKVIASDPAGASAEDEFDIEVAQPPILAILSTSPARNENHISTTDNIVINFDANVESSTLNTSNIIVRGEASGLIDGAFSGGGTSTITFNPDNSFIVGERVHVLITTNIEGTVSEVVAVPYMFSFSVESGSSTALFVAQDPIESNVFLPTSVHIIDLDGDGNSDVLSTSRDDKINWYDNNGAQSFSTITLSSAINGARDLFPLDLDNDGDLDVVTSAEDDGKLLWLENNGSESFAVNTIAQSLSGIKGVYSIDMDGDGDLDIVSASTFSLDWHENDGNQNFTTHDLGLSGNSPTACYAADIDNDGDIDIIGGSQTKLSWFENDGTQSFTQHDLPFSIGAAGDVFAIDLDDDGDIDLVSAERIDDEVVWYENDGNQSFSEHIVSNDADEVYAIVVADLDGDGDIDIASSSNSDDKVAWYENDGTESFSTHIISLSSNGPRSLFSGDIDGDGDLDLVSGNYDGNNIIWYENRANVSPVLENAIVDQVTNEDEEFSFSIPTNTFDDPDGDELTYDAELSDGSSLPDWLIFNGISGSFSGTPEQNDVGILTLSITASDGLGGEATDEFSLEVINANDAPILENTIVDRSAVALETFEFVVPSNTFSDEDGDDLTLSAELTDGSPLPGWLSFTSSTSTFSGTPGNDDVGAISIKVIADDGNGGSTNAEFDIEVLFTNQDPEVSNAIADQNASEDHEFTFIFDITTFSDPDDQELTYEALQVDGSDLPNWLTFTATERKFVGTPAQSDVGELQIRVVATDPAGASVFDDFIIVVSATNDAPVLLKGIVDQTAFENELFTFTLDEETFDDEDGDALSYSAQQTDETDLPAWLSFNDVELTFSGTPSVTDAGTITIEVTASDPSGESVSDIFNIVVELVNDAPTVLNPIADQEATQGKFFFLEFAENTFVDLDGDELTYTSTLLDGSPLPEWLTFSGIDRTYSGTPSSDDVGSISILLTAADSNGGTAQDTFVIEIIASKKDQTVSFEEIPEKTYGDDSFELSASASSGLTVMFSSSNESVATVEDNLVTLHNAGTTTISAFQEGNEEFNEAISDQILIVRKAAQTIQFETISEKSIDAPDFSLAATASSGLEVSFTSSDLNVATITGNVVSIVGEGTTVITASQEGNSNYNAAPEVEQTLSVTASKQSQTITFESIDDKIFGDAPFELNASASSGLTVSYESSDESIATISGNEVTIVGTGVTTITASQAGNDDFVAAENVSQSLLIHKATQTITFDAIEDKVFGDAPFSLSATTSSGLAISFVSSDESVATITGDQVSILAAGNVTITATQEGNANYEAASDVAHEFLIAKANQTITFETIEDFSVGGTIKLSATASSGLDVSFEVEGPASLDGNSLTILDEGTVTITASQSGDENWNAAESVSQILEITETTLGISNEVISVYPNPFMNVLYLDYPEPVDIRIYSLNGSEVISKKAVKVQLDLSSLDEGMYVLEIESPNEITRMRIKKVN
ncbi:FG-GAP-like repeat-containing protein [Ekhidna sp.]|uniref:FG-GAP-like repeat-containing protein n=1 Tax=Ekhidna sp. TaxID=2608089 RepID=UPI0032EC6787